MAEAQRRKGRRAEHPAAEGSLAIAEAVQNRMKERPNLRSEVPVGSRARSCCATGRLDASTSLRPATQLGTSAIHLPPHLLDDLLVLHAEVDAVG